MEMPIREVVAVFLISEDCLQTKLGSVAIPPMIRSPQAKNNTYTVRVVAKTQAKPPSF